MTTGLRSQKAAPLLSPPGDRSLEWLRVTPQDAKAINEAFEDAAAGSDGLKAAEMYWRMREVGLEPPVAGVEGRAKVDFMAQSTDGIWSGHVPIPEIYRRFLLKMLGRVGAPDKEESALLNREFEASKNRTMREKLALAYVQMRACGIDVYPSAGELAEIVKDAREDRAVIMYLSRQSEAEDSLKRYYHLVRLGVNEDYPQAMRMKARQALDISRREGDGYHTLVLLHYLRGILGAPGDQATGETIPPLRRFVG